MTFYRGPMILFILSGSPLRSFWDNPSLLKTSSTKSGAFFMGSGMKRILSLVIVCKPQGFGITKPD